MYGCFHLTSQVSGCIQVDSTFGFQHLIQHLIGSIPLQSCKWPRLHLCDFVAQVAPSHLEQDCRTMWTVYLYILKEPWDLGLRTLLNWKTENFVELKNWYLLNAECHGPISCSNVLFLEESTPQFPTQKQGVDLVQKLRLSCPLQDLWCTEFYSGVETVTSAFSHLAFVYLIDISQTKTILGTS